MVALVACLLLCGCSVFEYNSGAEKVPGYVPPVVEAADQVTEAVEGATGKPIMAPETAETVGGWAETGAEVTEAVGGAAKVVEPFVPEDKRPWLNAVVATLTALNGLALGVAEYMRRRKNAMRQTVIDVADAKPGLGSVVLEVAPANGTGDEIRKAYAAGKSAA